MWYLPSQQEAIDQQTKWHAGLNWSTRGKSLQLKYIYIVGVGEKATLWEWELGGIERIEQNRE